MFRTAVVIVIMQSVDSFSGGQVFRYALGFSALLGVEAKITGIRADRPKPGIQKQHLAGLSLLSQACNARGFGAKLGSLEVIFRPKPFVGGNFVLNVGSAGSTSLVLQSLLLPAMLKETRARVVGGTDVAFAPPANYLVHALFPVLSKMGCHFDLNIVSRGYFPKGNGCVGFHSRPSKSLRAINLSKPKNVFRIKIFCHSRGLPKEVASTMAKVAKKGLEHTGLEIIVSIDATDSHESTGCGIEIFGESNNCPAYSNALGKKGLPAEKVAQVAVHDFLEELHSGTGVDVHTSDQLIPFMALAKGKSIFSVRIISHHLQKSIEITEQFLPVKFEIHEKAGLFFVSVQGMDFFGKEKSTQP